MKVRSSGKAVPQVAKGRTKLGCCGDVTLPRREKVKACACGGGPILHERTGSGCKDNGTCLFQRHYFIGPHLAQKAATYVVELGFLEK